jgi:hypothetical protein
MFTIAKTFIMALAQTVVDAVCAWWHRTRNRVRVWWWEYTRPWDEDEYPW